MPIMFSQFDTRHWIGLWVFVFAVTVVTAPGHGGQAAIVLLFTALYFLFAKKEQLFAFPLSSHEKIFLTLVLIFFGWQLFGVLYQPEGYEYETIRQRFKAFDYPLRWLLLIPVFLLFRRYLIDWRVAAIGMSVGAIIAAGIAHYQVYYLGVARAWGGSSHQIPFAELMVAIDLLLWMLMIYAWDKGHKFLSGFLLLSSLAAFYGSLMSVTRGAWLAYVAMMLIWIIYTLGKTFRNIKHLFTTPILLRLLFAGVVFFAVSQTDQYKRIEARTTSSINNFAQGGIESADKARAILFEDSFTSIKAYPFGIGTDNFDAIKVDSPFMSEKGYRSSHAHNELLNIWVENGVQGLFSLAALLLFACYVFWKGLKSDNQLARLYGSCGLMLIVTYAIFGQTHAVFSHHDTIIFFVFYLYFFFGQVQVLLRKDEKLFT